jgi:ABC-type nitrate/sulfonate/bicarbonate transport system substrate-binding protein
MRTVERIAAALIVAVLAATAARAAEPYHLRIGWVVAGADVATLMFDRPGLAPHAGKSYVPELIHFQGTATEMQALATGQLDIAALAYSTFGLGIVNAGMQDLRVIGDVFQDGVPGYHTNDFIVRKDSPIHKVEDLKGKVLATNQNGSAVDMAVRAMLAKHHLQDKRDVTIIEVRFPDMAAMLKEGKVDFITAVTPFGFDPALQAFTRTLFTQADAIGRSQMIVHAARQGFLKEHHAAVVDFMQDYIHALRFFLDPANHAATVATLAKATKRKPEFFQSWAFTKEDYYRDPAALPDLDALQKNVDLQKQLGFLRKSIDVKNYADLSIVKEAAQRLAAGQ